MDEKEIDWKQQAVDILLNVIDNGLMDEQAIGRFTYYYMYALWFLECWEWQSGPCALLTKRFPQPGSFYFKIAY